MGYVIVRLDATFADQRVDVSRICEVVLKQARVALVEEIDGVVLRSHGVLVSHYLVLYIGHKAVVV